MPADRYAEAYEGEETMLKALIISVAVAGIPPGTENDLHLDYQAAGVAALCLKWPDTVAAELSANFVRAKNEPYAKPLKNFKIVVVGGMECAVIDKPAAIPGFLYTPAMAEAQPKGQSVRYRVMMMRERYEGRRVFLAMVERP